MLLEFDDQKLEKVIKTFHDAMGVSIIVMRDDYTVLASKKINNPYCRLVQNSKRGLAKCIESNNTLLERCKESKRAEMHICPAGLVEISVPILRGNDLVGYVSFGHIKMMNNKFSIPEFLTALSIEDSLIEEIYNSVPSLEKDKISAMIEMSKIFAEYIVDHGLLKLKDSEIFEDIKQYILDNYDKKLTAQIIADDIHLSKTALYNIVKKSSGYTVNEYVNRVKIEKSKKLLLETDYSIELIAKKLAFSTGTYYSLLFKKHIGVTPSEFRK